MDSVQTLTKKLLVSNRCGIHLRVAAMLAKTAREFSSEIKVRRGSYQADCRSILDLLSLGAFQGDLLILDVTGSDAEDAMNAIVALFEVRFHEDVVEEIIESDQASKRPDDEPIRPGDGEIG